MSSISTGSVTGRGTALGLWDSDKVWEQKVWKVLLILKCKAHLHLNFNVVESAAISYMMRNQANTIYEVTPGPSSQIMCTSV